MHIHTDSHVGERKRETFVYKLLFQFFQGFCADFKSNAYSLSL